MDLPTRNPASLSSLVTLLTAFVSWQAHAASPNDVAKAFEIDAAVAESTKSTFTGDLESPWGMEFLPDGKLIVTERPGRLRIIGRNGEVVSAIEDGLPKVDRGDHGGLLDVRVDPQFATNRILYLSYTEARWGFWARTNGLTVARARLSEDATHLEAFKVLFRQRPGVRSTENLGGRLAVSTDGYLFITVGDRYKPSERIHAQDLDHYHGKTLRIRTDGTIPDDNPFARREDARPEIWSLGHRNPQGAFVHPETGVLWIAEHGPFGGDEVNIVQPGRNYGWPIVTYGCEYDTCAPIGEGTTRSDMEPPLSYWARPSIAPSNLILYTSDRIPQWQGSVFVGALGGRAVWRLVLAGEGRDTRVVRREALFADLGERVRDIRQGPDGALYLLTDGNGARVIRIMGHEYPTVPMAGH